MDTNHTHLKLNGLSNEPTDPQLLEIESLLNRVAAADRAAAGPALEDRLMLATTATLVRASATPSTSHPAGRSIFTRGRRTAWLSLAAVLALVVTIGTVWLSNASSFISPNLALNGNASDSGTVIDAVPNPVSPVDAAPIASAPTSEDVFAAMTESMDALSQLDGELPDALTLLASETTQLEETLTINTDWAADSSM